MEDAQPSLQAQPPYGAFQQPCYSAHNPYLAPHPSQYPYSPSYHSYPAQPYFPPPQQMPLPGTYSPQGGFSYGYSSHVPLYLQGNPRVPQAKCRYGAACIRQGCIYQHPLPPAVDGQQQQQQQPRGGGGTSTAAASTNNNNRICLAFLTHSCLYDKNCFYKHPQSKEECDKVRAVLSAIPCKFGAQCQQELCLFLHPQTAQA